MKHFLVLNLAVLLMLSVSGCGTSGSDVSGTTKAESVEDSASDEKVTSENLVTESGLSEVALSSLTDSRETSVLEAETPDVTTTERVTESGEYINDAVRLGITFDDRWVIADDDALAQLNNMVVDNCTDEDLAAQIAESGVATVLYAIRTTDNANINMNIQNINVVYGMMLDEDDIIDATIDQLPASLSAYGYENTSSEKDTIVFAGTVHPCIRLKGILNGTEVYEIIVCYKQGNYVSACTAAATDFSICEDVLNLFHSVENA